MTAIIFILGLYFLIYLIGGFPSAYIVTKLVKGKDITKIGSGNVGARNVFENVDKTLGIITLLLDFGKAAIAHLIYAKFELFFLLSLLMLVLGHNFSPYLKFKGGKGLATSIFFVFLENPFFIFLALAIYGLLSIFFKKMSLKVNIAIIILLILLNIYIEKDILTSIVLYMALTIKWLPNPKHSRKLH